MMTLTQKKRRIPEHALKDIINNKMWLHNHEQQGHMCPAILYKLKFVVTLPQIHHKEHKAYMVVKMSISSFQGQ